jgi:hypothetical protein
MSGIMPLFFCSQFQVCLPGLDLPPGWRESAKRMVGPLIVFLEGQERKVNMQKIEQVEWLSPDELIPYEMNAKIHPADQIERIANGIKAFGWTQPIVVDRDNIVVIGHGRLAAAKELMLEKVPVVRRDDLTDEQIRACRLEDNKTNESP